MRIVAPQSDHQNLLWVSSSSNSLIRLTRHLSTNFGLNVAVRKSTHLWWLHGILGIVPFRYKKYRTTQCCEEGYFTGRDQRCQRGKSILRSQTISRRTRNYDHFSEINVILDIHKCIGSVFLFRVHDENVIRDILAVRDTCIFLGREQMRDLPQRACFSSS